MARRTAVVGLLAVLAGLCGCGGKKVSVSGTITQGGEKLTWPDGGSLLVIFLPENPEKNLARYSAKTDTETSSFAIDAIPPGKYTVAVQQFDTRFMDGFNKAYDPGRTTLVREVTHDGQVIDIDIPAAGERRGGGFGGRRGKKAGDPPAEKHDAPGKVELAPPPREPKPDAKKD